MNKISLIVLNYNDYKTTSEYLNIVKNYAKIDKIVVVDNNSTDDSYEKLYKYNSDYIHVIKSDTNGGYGSGNNIGIKYAINNFNSQYILVSNPDVQFEEDIIRKMMEVYKTYDNVGIVAPIMKQHGEGDIVAWKIAKWSDDIILTNGILKKLYGNPLLYKKQEINKEVNFVDVLPGSFFMISQKAIVDAEYFDEDTFLYCEERILAYKLKKLGYRNILLGDISYIHMHSISIDKNIKSNLKKYEILCDSRLIYQKKYLKINLFKELITKLIFKIGKIERIIFYLLRNKR